MKRLILLLLISASTLVAEINLFARMPSITMKNGATYTDFQFISFTEKVFSAKWKGGRGSFPYDLLPDGLRDEAEKQRPGFRPESLRPGESELGLARQRSDQERRMVNAQRRIRDYENAIRAERAPPMLRSEYEEAKIEYRDAKAKFDELSGKLR